MIKYTAPEMEKVVVETSDIVLTSACSHTYVDNVCTKCGHKNTVDLPEEEF